MFAALYAPSMPAAAVLDVARAFTPRFEPLGAVVLLDASGLSRLFGTAEELGEHLREALAKHSPGDTMSRVAIASTQTAATLLALGTPGLTVVVPGKEAIALAPLSVNVLDQFDSAFARADSASARETLGELRRDPAVAASGREGGGWHHPRTTHQASRGRRRAPENRLLEILQKWGIRTLGALAALSGPDLYERLGDRGVAWQSLARGVDTRPLVPWVEEVPFEAALELEWPIEGLEPLSFVLARLLEPLADRLERADRGAAVIYTSLRLATRTVFTRTLQLPAPMRDPKTLRTLILLDLESHPPDAPIDIVRVSVEPTPARVLQWTLLERAQPAPEQVSTLVARLSALMGEGRVGSPGLVDTWRPGAFAMSDFGSRIADQCQKVDGRIERQSSNHPSAIDPQSEICDLRSALRRFRVPLPVLVRVEEGRPVRVQIDRHGLASGTIAQAAGPWRTSGDWWSASAREQSGELRRDSSASAREQSGELRRDSSASAREQPGELRRDHHIAAAFGEGGWDRDEWDIAMTDGTIYRLIVERDAGQWFVEGVID